MASQSRTCFHHSNQEKEQKGRKFAIKNGEKKNKEKNKRNTIEFVCK
jgi:hypothetical protein